MEKPTRANDEGFLKALAECWSAPPSDSSQEEDQVEEGCDENPFCDICHSFDPSHADNCPDNPVVVSRPHEGPGVWDALAVALTPAPTPDSVLEYLLTRSHDEQHRVYVFLNRLGHRL